MLEQEWEQRFVTTLTRLGCDAATAKRWSQQAYSRYSVASSADYDRDYLPEEAADDRFTDANFTKLEKRLKR
jgi:hypothetical protein